ncbi:uncharacterized protein si:ch211-214p13.8 [Leucoraja erinacea]|uniref:uncharacterized protein si:ch211-214p13.8 n=1 Tax=Leucoraja erinaceus TaxID=7782 RepID=UPI00245758DE|nr:uncharacterized protein si:ch211-214p13.8 [Leucoraja erinacea]
MMVYRRTMWFAKTLKHFLLVSLLPFTVHLQGNKTCLPSVVYPKATYNYSIGDTLVLNCSVQLCKLIPNSITWYKMSANNSEKIDVKNVINSSSVIFVAYTVSSVNLTDSGKYQCIAAQGLRIAQGHIITVNVHGVKPDSYETSTTVTPTNATMTVPNPDSTPLWIFYGVILVGIVGAVVFLVMMTYFCIRNFQEPLETVEPRNSCQGSQCHGMTEMNGKSTIYENMNKFSEGVSSSSPNPLTVNERKSPQNRTENTKFSDTPQQDTIIYASLKESMLSRKPSMKFVDNEDTEYAAINIKYQVE